MIFFECQSLIEPLCRFTYFVFSYLLICVMRFLGFERLVNFFLTYNHAERVSPESLTPTNVTSALQMNRALHRGPALGRVDNVQISTPPPPRRSMASGRYAAPVPVQGLDMLSVMQKTLAHRRQSSSSKWQNSSHQSSSGPQFQNVNLQTTSSNADFDMPVSKYSKQRHFRDHR